VPTSRFRIDPLVERAQQHNRDALAAMVARGWVSPRTAAQTALRFAQQGVTGASNVENRRQAIVEVAVASIWAGESCDVMTMFQSTHPASAAFQRVLVDLSKRADAFNIPSFDDNPQVQQLRELAATFAEASLDSALKEQGFAEGLTDGHRAVMSVFQRRGAQMFDAIGERKIWNACRRAGLNMEGTTAMLEELMYSGVVEPRPGPRERQYVLSTKGGQIARLLPSAAPVVPAMSL